MSSTLGARQWSNPNIPVPASTHAQAMINAYPSRARTGSTLLMQPIGLAPVPPNHNVPAPALSHTASFGPSRRTRGGVVNYAEMEDDEDENVDVDGEPAPGPAPTAPIGIIGTPKPTGELDRSYLGIIPPAKFIHPSKATRIHQEYFSEARLVDAASRRAIYVPIRLELNTDSHQIRDSFLWNVNESLITPATFAQQLCLDLGLPPAQHADLIAAAIAAQCEEHRWVASVQLRPRRKRKELGEDSVLDTQELALDSTNTAPPPRDPRIESLRTELHGISLSPQQETSAPGTGAVTPSVTTSATSPAPDGPATPAPIAVNIDDELDPTNTGDGKKTLISAVSDKLETNATTPVSLDPTASVPHVKPANEEQDGDESESEVDSESDYETDTDVGEPDCRVIVSLDLQISTHHLHDHIEWDLASPLTPEHFARVLCADTGLAGEAVPLVACALREALLKHTKDAVEAGLVGPGAGEGRPEPLVANSTSRKEAGSEALRSIFRDWQDAEEYFPRLELLNPEELERRAMERERAIRHVF